MNVQVLDIQVSKPSADGLGTARVLLQIADESGWFDFTIKPLADFGPHAEMVSASTALYEKLAPDQQTVHRICSVVGQASREGSVQLPLLVAA